jgi:hypothetical protein
MDEEEDAFKAHCRILDTILKDKEQKHYEYYYQMFYKGGGEEEKTVSKVTFKLAYLSSKKAKAKIPTLDYAANRKLAQEAGDMYNAIIQKAIHDARITKNRELFQKQLEVGDRIRRLRRVFKYLWLITPRLPRDIIKIIYLFYRTKTDPYVEIPSYLYIDFTEFENVY